MIKKRGGVYRYNRHNRHLQYNTIVKEGQEVGSITGLLWPIIDSGIAVMIVVICLAVMENSQKHFAAMTSLASMVYPLFFS
jgi:hypothetical protein